MTNDDLHELAAPYALDAVDADERVAFETHLRECERCRAELASLRETVGALAYPAEAYSKPYPRECDSRPRPGDVVTKTDPLPGLDDNDELVFMASDAGEYNTLLRGDLMASAAEIDWSAVTPVGLV